MGLIRAPRRARAPTAQRSRSCKNAGGVALWKECAHSLQAMLAPQGLNGGTADDGDESDEAEGDG